jgi:hypothetical protein
MEELNDDELQELLSNGSIPGDNMFSEKSTNDLLAYQNLFRALSTEPEQGLPLQFASNVRRKLQEQANRKNDLRFNIMAVGIFAATLGLSYGLITLISPENGTMVVNTVLRFKWVLTAIIFAFFSFMLIDQRLVKRNY